jgi:hypothetical protein
MKKFLGLKGRALNWAIGLIAGCDFLLFGYGQFSIILSYLGSYLRFAHVDQGVMGGILTMPIFLNSFPLINPNETGISAAEQSSRSTNQGEFTFSTFPQLGRHLTSSLHRYHRGVLHSWMFLRRYYHYMDWKPSRSQADDYARY